MILARKTKDGFQQSLLDHSLSVFDQSFIILKEYENNLNEILKKTNYEFSYKDCVSILYLSSLFHDVGKASYFFQNDLLSNEKLLDKTEELLEDKELDKLNIRKGYLPHNLISILVFESIEDNYLYSFFDELNKTKKEKVIKLIKYLILFHHSKKNTYPDYDKLKLVDFFKNPENKLEYLIKNIKDYLEEVNKSLKNLDFLKKEDVFKNLFIFDESYFMSLKNKKSTDIFVDFKEYHLNIDSELVLNESFKNILRLIFNKSDKIAAALFEKKHQLKQHYDKSEFNKLNCFNFLDDDNAFPLNNRTLKQNEVALEIFKSFKNNNFMILDGAPGVGKTRIFYKIFSHLNENNIKDKMVIITPRNMISISLFKELEDLSYLLPEDKSISCEILNSEENKRIILSKTDEKIILEEDENFENKTLQNKIFESDICFISIDKLVQVYNNNKNIFNIYSLFNSFLIFDEFHEIFEQPLLLVYFKEILEVLMFFNSKILLTSGTINKAMLKEFLSFNLENKIKELDSFNDKKINVKTINSIEDLNYLKSLSLNTIKNNSIFIYNTATQAQKGAIQLLIENEKIDNLYLFHSLYLKEDRENIYQKIKKVFGNKNELKNRSVLLSGPIVQASLNISCKLMTTEKTNADNFVQRLGRLNRFSEFEEGDFYVLKDGIFKKNYSNKNKEFRMIKENLENEFILFFDDCVKKIQENEKEVNLNKVRKIYKLFNEKLLTDLNLNNILMGYIDELYNQASEIFTKIKERYPVYYSEKTEEENKKKKKEKNLTLKNGIRGDGSFLCKLKVFDLFLESGNKKTVENLKLFYKKDVVFSVNFGKIIFSLNSLRETLLQKKEVLNENEQDFLKIYSKTKTKLNKIGFDLSEKGILGIVNKEIPLPLCIENVGNDNILDLNSLNYEKQKKENSDFEQFVYLQNKDFKIGLFKLKNYKF